MGFGVGCSTNLDLAGAVMLDLGGGFLTKLVCFGAEVLAGG